MYHLDTWSLGEGIEGISTIKLFTSFLINKYFMLAYGPVLYVSRNSEINNSLGFQE